MDFPVYPAGHLFGVHPTQARAHGQEGGGRRETVPGTVSWRGERTDPAGVLSRPPLGLSPITGGAGRRWRQENLGSPALCSPL